MIGLERGVVRLVPYTSEWLQLFEVGKNALQQVVGANILDIQHVGSTAIPGMLAKPTIDIVIAVTDFEQAKVYIPLIEGLGYEYRGEQGIPSRHMFAKGNPRTFHVHMFEMENLESMNHLLFRDNLCQHPDAVQEYAQLKLQLATQYSQDREAYTEGKAAFIKRVLQLARLQLSSE
jgi:GrpB-like predicted nucleotidyltransferase (UPF0157 family)